MAYKYTGSARRVLARGCFCRIANSTMNEILASFRASEDALLDAEAILSSMGVGSKAVRSALVVRDTTNDNTMLICLPYFTFAEPAIILAGGEKEEGTSLCQIPGVLVVS